MAAKNGKTAVVQQLPGFVKGPLEEAQRKWAELEVGAERTLKDLVSKGKSQRKELETLVNRVAGGELFDSKVVKRWSKKAEQASTGVLEKFDALQSRVVEAAGVASQEQVRELHRELGKLSKKLDVLVGKKAGKPEPRA